MIRVNFIIWTTPIFSILLAVTSIASEYKPEKSEFLVKVKNEIIPYKVMGIFVLPQEIVSIEALSHQPEGDFIFLMEKGKLSRLSPAKWNWQAPAETGLHPLTLFHPQTGDSLRLNIFVMVPFEELKGEYLNGYRIGKYPTLALKNLSIYQPPKGFIEVTPENEETFISPHFQIKQFLSKQSSDYPKYLALRERLILKLEMILEKVNEKGIDCNTFFVMSGYRTPFYNKAIKNVTYSRHIWGGAADIFIDQDPEDGMMDDLNNDGKIDYSDAEVLYKIIDDLYGEPWYHFFIGGLGKYKKTPSHGPFVHVDVRGFKARW